MARPFFLSLICTEVVPSFVAGHGLPTRLLIPMTLTTYSNDLVKQGLRLGGRAEAGGEPLADDGMGTGELVGWRGVG
jgi:hypothetical protein